VDFVLHAGRQSLLQDVQDKVAEAFPKAQAAGRIVLEKKGKELLKVCVAKGAALFGRMLDQGGGPGTFLLLQERYLPHAYGWDHPSTFGLSEFETIIPSGESYPNTWVAKITGPDLPASGRLCKTLLLNRGTGVNVESNPEIVEVGDLEYDFDPTTTEEILVHFSVDENRRLTVQVGDKVIAVRPPRPTKDLDWMG